MLVLGLLACLLLAGCGRGQAIPDEQVSQGDIAALASEAAEALDEAVAASGVQLEEAAEVVSEAVAVGELGMATPGVVVVGTNADFLPFVGYLDDELTGFDIALFDEIAARVGLSPVYTDMPFPNLTGALTAGEVDVIMAAITVTPEREEVIDFSRPYFVGSQALGVPAASTVQGLEDLGGDQVLAVLTGTTGEDYAEEHLADVTVESFADRAGALAALRVGTVDAVLMDTDAVVEQAREGALLLVEEVPTDERYGIGLPEGNAPLRAALNSALADVLADGTYRELFQQWFPARDVDQAIGLLQ